MTFKKYKNTEGYQMSVVDNVNFKNVKRGFQAKAIMFVPIIH